MKFGVLFETLYAALAPIHALAKSSKSLPILNSMLLIVKDGRAYLSSTNLELGCQVDIAALVEIEGSQVVSTDTIWQFLKGLPKSEHDKRIDFELTPGTPAKYKEEKCDIYQCKEGFITCSSCGGSGKAKSAPSIDCFVCHGKGKHECGICHGTGNKRVQTKAAVLPVLAISTTKRRIRVPMPFDVEEYPVWKYELPEDGCVMSVTEFRRVTGNILPALAKEDNRPILTGMLFQADKIGRNITFAGADGYRLHVETADTSDVFGDMCAIVPGNSIKFLIDYLPKAKGKSADNYDVCFGAEPGNPGRILFQSNHVRITSQLIDGKFPDWAQIVPESTPYHININRKELLDELQAARYYSKKVADNIHLVAQHTGDLKVWAATQDMGDSEVDIPVFEQILPADQDITISINNEFLIDALNIIDVDNALLKTSGGYTPLVVERDGPGGPVVVIMPMSVNR